MAADTTPSLPQPLLLSVGPAAVLADKGEILRDWGCTWDRVASWPPQSGSAPGGGDSRCWGAMAGLSVPALPAAAERHWDILVSGPGSNRGGCCGLWFGCRAKGGWGQVLLLGCEAVVNCTPAALRWEGTCSHSVPACCLRNLCTGGSKMCKDTIE